MREQRIAFVSMCILCLSACSVASSEKEQLSETIEAALQLPEGAWPLDRYERYYAKGNGRILGVYTVHSADHRRQVLKLCRGLDDDPFPCPSGGEGLRLVAAGQSLWLDDPEDLPATSGGGCSLVTISYLPSERKFERIECNGEY